MSSGASWPSYGEDESAAVARVLASGRVNYWTGTEGRTFESEFADFTGVNHAVFVSNGTVGLELALRALGLKPGSEVITTPRTFIASASAIVAAGLIPVFADVDVDSGNITPDSATECLSERTAAVLVVHLGGWPADMPGFRALCDMRGLALVEDCSQAHGAMVGDAHVGTFGDVAAWSFCQDKIISTGGEGGMVATNSQPLWQRMWSYKDHGKSWNAVYEREHPPGFRWLHDAFGTNWRGTEMQAAIGRVQYRKLLAWREQRTANAMALAARLAEIPGVRVPLPHVGLTHAYYRLYGYVEQSRLRSDWSCSRIVAEMGALGSTIFTGSCSEIYLEKAFIASGLAPQTRLPNAARLGEESLAFRVHPGLTDKDMEDVALGLREVMQRARAR